MISAEINAGKILLEEVCSYFNDREGYPRINDVMNIHSDDKQALLKFINSETNNICDFQLRSLNRIIKNIKENKFQAKIPSGNATLCTLCYIALKRKNSDLKLRYQLSHREKHAQSMYVVDFTNEFITPVFARMQKSGKGTTYYNSCWYLYINVVDKNLKLRKTGRKILKLSEENQSLKAEYFATNVAAPDWLGFANFDEDKKLLIVEFKALKNEKRKMVMEFTIEDSIPKTIEGTISYTSINEMDIEIQTKIFLQKVDCNENLYLKEINDGEDELIKEIEVKLKEVKAISKKVTPLHDCHD